MNILAISLWIIQAAIPFRSQSFLVDTTLPNRSILNEEKAIRLLASDPVYTEYWNNQITFTYDSVKSVDLPEVSRIPILDSNGQFTPTWYGKLTSGYKWRWGRQHHGVDIALKTGAPVFAAFEGIVRYAQWNKSGYGNCVVIRHKNGLETLYGHMSKLLVEPNQYVHSGDTIGLGGSTGNSSGPHLHFEIRYKDFSINPELIIDFSTLSLKVDTFAFLRANISGSRYSGDINALPTKTNESSSYEQHLDAQYNAESGDTHPISYSPSSDEISGDVKSPQKQQTKSKQGSIKKSTADKKKTQNAKTKSPASKKNIQVKKASTYEVKKGDTYTSISKKTGVPISKLKSMNPKEKENTLQPGKRLRIQ